MLAAVFLRRKRAFLSRRLQGSVALFSGRNRQTVAAHEFLFDGLFAFERCSIETLLAIHLFEPRDDPPSFIWILRAFWLFRLRVC